MAGIRGQPVQCLQSVHIADSRINSICQLPFGNLSR